MLRFVFLLFWGCAFPVFVFAAGVTVIDVERAKELFDDGAVFLDVRGDANWEAERVASAIHFVYEDDGFLKDALLDEVGLNEAVVVYGVGGDLAAQAMMDAGFEEVYYFEGGYLAWVEMGYPVE